MCFTCACCAVCYALACRACALHPRAHVGELSFTVVQSECRPSFGAFAKCLDKNNVDFSLCRKEAAAFSACAAAADAAFAAKPNVDKTA